MKKETMKILVIIVALIIAIPVALFIGKTTINDWHIKVERPCTAILFYFTLVAGMIES